LAVYLRIIEAARRTIPIGWILGEQPPI